MHESIARAAALRYDIPDYLYPTFQVLLSEGIISEQDFEPSRGDAKVKDKEPSTSGQMQPYPVNFPAETGITYENIFDRRTEKIIAVALKRAVNSGLFLSPPIEVESAIRRKLPFAMLKFIPLPEKPDSRYVFTSTVVYNLVKSMITRKRGRISEDAETKSQKPYLVSLDREFNDNDRRNLLEIIPDRSSDRLKRQQEASEELVVILPRLSGRDRQILFMHSWLNLTYREIGKRLGISKSAVEKRLNSKIPHIARRITAEGGIR